MPAPNMVMSQNWRRIRPSADPKPSATLVGDAGGEKPETRVKIRRARVRLELPVARVGRGPALCLFAVESAPGDSPEEFCMRSFTRDWTRGNRQKFSCAKVCKKSRSRTRNVSMSRLMIVDRRHKRIGEVHPGIGASSRSARSDSEFICLANGPGNEILRSYDGSPPSSHGRAK